MSLAPGRGFPYHTDPKYYASTYAYAHMHRGESPVEGLTTIQWFYANPCTMTSAAAVRVVPIFCSRPRASPFLYWSRDNPCLIGTRSGCESETWKQHTLFLPLYLHLLILVPFSGYRSLLTVGLLVMGNRSHPLQAKRSRWASKS